MLFWTVLDIAVPDTTGFPAGRLYEPDPFLGMVAPEMKKPAKRVYDWGMIADYLVAKLVVLVVLAFIYGLIRGWLEP